jgi:hypothetical protein
MAINHFVTEGTKSLKQYLWNFSEKLSAYRGDNGLKAAGQAMPKKKKLPPCTIEMLVVFWAGHKPQNRRRASFAANHPDYTVP